MTTRKPAPPHVWDSHKHDAELHGRIRELEAELAEWKAHGAKLDETYGDVKARAEKAIKHLGSHGYPEFSDDCSECKDLASIGQLAREREASE